MVFAPLSWEKTYGRKEKFLLTHLNQDVLETSFLTIVELYLTVFVDDVQIFKYFYTYYIEKYYFQK